MTDRATTQSDNIVPPRRFVAASGSPLVGTQTGVWVQAVDSTARPYQISLLPLGGRAATNPGQADHLYITLLAETNDVYFYFNNATASDLSETAINGLGTALTATTMATTMGARLPKDVAVSVRIERSQDTWIVLKCAAATTATLRVWASSQAEV